jgi:hypothetical protein
MPISGRILTFGTLLLCLVGCGPSTAKVSGTVTYNGKPVVWGSVNLRDAKGQTYQAQIQPDGKYLIDQAAWGKHAVMVFSPDPLPPSTGAPRKEALSGALKEKMELRAKWFAIPAKYGDYEKSELNLDVNKNPTVFEITLKD